MKHYHKRWFKFFKALLIHLRNVIDLFQCAFVMPELIFRSELSNFYGHLSPESRILVNKLTMK